jgi:drug/metabolite transporter (DMT)-like permease
MSLLSWAIPLLVTILSYGLAAGIWKHAALSAGQFCLLFVATKTVTNWGAWAAFSRIPLAGRDLKRFYLWALVAQLFNGLAWIFYFTALSNGPVSIVQTVTAAYTAVSVILALIFLKERVSTKQVAGIALVVVAAMLFGWRGGGESESATSSLWFTASLATLLFWGVTMVAIKSAYNQAGADDYRLFIANWLGMLLTVAPYGAWASQGETWAPEAIGLGLVIVLLYCIGDLTLFAAIKRGPASIVSPLSGLYPIPTIIYAALVLGEKITMIDGAGIAMVLVGMLLIVPKEEKKEAPA